MISFSPGGGYSDVPTLLKDKCLKDFIVLHDNVQLRQLESKWLTILEYPWHQKCTAVRDYFGEKIALYFLWLGFYTSWLFPAAFVGFFGWVNVAVNSKFCCTTHDFQSPAYLGEPYPLAFRFFTYSFLLSFDIIALFKKNLPCMLHTYIFSSIHCPTVHYSFPTPPNSDNDPSAQMMPYYAAFMALWATMFTGTNPWVAHLVLGPGVRFMLDHLEVASSDV